MLFNKKKKTESNNTVNLNLTDNKKQQLDGVRSITDYIYPSGIDATNSDYVLIDGTYYSTLLCLDFPYYVGGAWLEDIINAGEGIEISLYHEPQNKTKMIREITTQMGYTKFNIGKGDIQKDSELQQNAFSHAGYIKKALAEGDDIWFVHLLIRISAYSKAELEQRSKQIESILAGKSIFYQRSDFRQMEAFLSTLPLYDFQETFKEQTARNILTSGLCSTYPFTAFELSDAEGVYVGNNEHNDSPVILDIFNTKKYTNANMCVMGTSGAGKTFTIQLLARRTRLQNIPVMMITPLKGFEYYNQCVELGGNFIRLSAGSKQRINLFDIRPSSGEFMEENQQTSLLHSKIQKLQLATSLLIPDIENIDKQRLDEKFLMLYDKKGITQDNASIYRKAENKGNVLSFFLFACLKINRYMVTSGIQKSMPALEVGNPRHFFL